MKILRLNLLAFGPFSGHALEFDKTPAPLHVVYGPNEAGKSSSLRALRHFLYGIPHNCTDNFIHPNTNLRIGGVLQDSLGTQLEFIRRKGRDKTLRGADDVQVLESATLLRMLGGVDEASFCQRFGIGYEELREGGRAIVEGEGELGTVLFAAGAGLADVRQVQARIEAELQDLFKSAGSNPRINKTLADLKLARDKIKEALLPTSQWVEEDKALKAAKKRQQEADGDLINKKARKRRLERLIQAAPLIADRSHWLEQIATVAETPLLPEDFAAKRREAQVGLTNSQQAEQEATAELARLQKAIAGVAVPQGLLERRTAISHLHSDLGSYQKAAKDRPGLVAQKRQADERATEILQELGRDADLTKANQLRLTKSQRQRIQELATECKSQLDKHRAAEANSQKLANELKAAETHVASLPAALSADGLKQVIRQAQKHGDLDEQLIAAAQALQQLEAEARAELQQLPLFSGTLDQLEQMPVCDSETIDRFENEFADVAAATQRINNRIDELTHKIQTLDGQLEVLRLAHDVPTEFDLAEARRQRDEGWQFVRNSLTEDAITNSPLVTEFIEHFASGTDLPQSFQVSIERADVVADRLRHEADRVAEKVALTANRGEIVEQLGREQQLFEQTKERLLDLQLEWMTHWTSLGAAPLPPREMRPWLRRQQLIASKVQAIRTQGSAMAAKAALRDSLRSGISLQLQQLDQTPLDANMSLADLVASSDTIIASTDASNRQRVDAEQKLKELKAKLVNTQEDLVQATSDLQKWKSDWADAVAAIGLPNEASTSEAMSVVQSVDDLQTQLKESLNLVDRIAGIDRDEQTFKVEVQTLVTSVAPDLASQSVDLAVSDLIDRLSAATGAQARLDEWKEQIADEESKRNKALLGIERWQSELTSLCAAAKCLTADQLANVEQHSAMRRKCEDKLASIKEQLVTLAGGDPLDDFVKDAVPASPNEMHSELQELTNAIEELERVKTEANKSIGAHQTELKRMNGNDLAAEARGQVEHLLAVANGDVDQYIRLRLAASVLKRSIERFRENSQGPVVSRAGEIFADMTLGAFSGLRADYDDKGKATLVGVRAVNGQSVSVTGMSDGTCDQLYLALRLALLESYLRDHEPIPFVVDDILIQFDDDRAVASLKALAELSKKTQVIFFTHHEHLVELARKHVDANVQCTHRLDSRNTSATPTAIAAG